MLPTASQIVSVETYLFLKILILVKFQDLNCFKSLGMSLARKKDT